MINFRTILLLSNGAPGCFISPCKNSCPKLEWTFTDDTHHPVFSDYRVEASLAGKRGTGSIDRSLDFFSLSFLILAGGLEREKPLKKGSSQRRFETAWLCDTNIIMQQRLLSRGE